MEQQAHEQRTPLTHEVRRHFLNPIRDRIRALRDAMVKVIQEQVAERVTSYPDGRIPLEEQVVVRNDEYSTIMITAIEVNKDGSATAVLEDDMTNQEDIWPLKELALDHLAQVIDSLHIEVPDRLLPVSETGAEYQPILAAFEVARDTAEALKDQLLAAVAKSQGLAEPDILAIDLVEPLSDQELEALYAPDELEEIIAYKDNTDAVECFATFTARAEEVGYRHLFTYDRVDYYLR